MSDGLDVIIVDDDLNVCEIITDIVKGFYTWGDVVSFSDVDVAASYCMSRDVGVAIFIVDVFLGGKSGFFFLDTIEEKFPTAHEDSIIITGNASGDIVNMCVAANVFYLLEKPIRSFALQLAVRSIVSKYLKFSKKLLQDPVFAEMVAKVDIGMVEAAK
ncbi:MAG: response regulator [Deltaproteobacteria bacterium]|nr:response regulator [Deltaproteobacteria bacterium]MBW2150594.1 response regulator [Deltaproteobacteria bacterium]